MRILAVGSTFDLPELHIFSGLVARGYQVEAIVSKDSRLISKLQDSGITCHILDFKSRVDISTLFKLRRILKAQSYDVLHCLTARGLSNGLLAAIRIPIHIIAYRGTSGRDSRFSPASWFSFLNPRVERIICVSNAVREFMSELVPAQKLVTIYKGHDIAWYQPRRDLSLGAVGVPNDAFVVACVANMRPVKGVKYLLEALKILVQRGDEDTHLLLIGEMRSESKLDILQDPLIQPRLHLAGYQTDVASFVARSNVFVLPSVEREGLPKAMLEAMALGLPTIVTNVGGMPEVVKHLQNGVVVAPRSAQEIADAITLLKNDPEKARSLGEAAQRTIKEVFTVERAVNETAAVYDSLASEVL